MKLSDAIRVGAKMRPASERGWNDVGSDGQLRSCALVAAAEGAGLFTIAGTAVLPGPNWLKPLGENSHVRDETAKGPGIQSRMPDEWAAVTSSRELPPCPCRTFHVTDVVLVLIWHLHDVHGWSREAVAEWIGTIEDRIAEEAAEREARRLRIAKDLGVEP